MGKRIALAALAAWAAVAAAARAEGDARAIVQRMNDRTLARDEQGTMSWRVLAKDGSEKRLRLVYRQKKGEKGRQLVLLRFLAPREVRRTALLSLSGGGRPDDQWVYLPDLRKVKRVAPAEGSERFLGSDFAYDDLRSLDLDAATYRLLRRENVGIDPCDVVEAVPAPDRTSESPYGKRTFWIRVKDAFPVRTQFFAKDGTLQKTLAALEIVETGAYVRADRFEMRDERGGSRTIVTVEDRRIDEGIPDRIFSERELEEGD